MPVSITTEDRKPEPPKQPDAEKNYKHGGKTKKMAMGGGMPVPPPMPMRGRAGMAGSRGALLSKPRVSMPMPPPQMSAPQMSAPQMPAGPAMKKGGKMHHKAEGGDVAQDKAMIKKAFKEHDTQEHKGGKGTHLALKKGGKMQKYAKGGGVKDAGSDTPGGLLGGIEATRPVSKKGTGAVMRPGYKDGGHVKQQMPSGSKDCGHDSMGKGMAKHRYGHDEADSNPMKRGGSAIKMSTHMKKGGACNY